MTPVTPTKPMTQTKELERLLVAATGPDRELDARIWAEFDGRDVRDDLERGMMLAKSRKPPHDECVIGYIDPGKRSRNFSADGFRPGPNLPNYTASLDAASTLVERVVPGAQWEVEGPKTPCATLFAEQCDDQTHFAATPAIALCLADIRATLEE